MSIRSLFSGIQAVVWSGSLGFLIIIFGSGVWAALVAANLNSTPKIPWAVPAMAIILWLIWQYLGGRAGRAKPRSLVASVYALTGFQPRPSSGRCWRAHLRLWPLPASGS